MKIEIEGDAGEYVVGLLPDGRRLSLVADVLRQEAGASPERRQELAGFLGITETQFAELIAAVVQQPTG